MLYFVMAAQVVYVEASAVIFVEVCHLAVAALAVVHPGYRTVIEALAVLRRWRALMARYPATTDSPLYVLHSLCLCGRRLTVVVMVGG